MYNNNYIDSDVMITGKLDTNMTLITYITCGGCGCNIKHKCNRYYKDQQLNYPRITIGTDYCINKKHKYYDKMCNNYIEECFHV